MKLTNDAAGLVRSLVHILILGLVLVSSGHCDLNVSVVDVLMLSSHDLIVHLLQNISSCHYTLKFSHHIVKYASPSYFS